MAAVSDPQTLPSCHHSGNQALRTQLLRSSKHREPGPSDCDLGRWLLLLTCRDRDGEDVHCHLKVQAPSVGDLGKGFGALWDPVPHPGPPSSPTGLRPGELESRGQKARILLFPRSSADDHHPTNQRLNRLTNGPLIESWLLWAARCGTAHWLSRTTNAHSETVWAGPIVMPTDG